MLSIITNLLGDNVDDSFITELCTDYYMITESPYLCQYSGFLRHLLSKAEQQELHQQEAIVHIEADKSVQVM